MIFTEDEISKLLSENQIHRKCTINGETTESYEPDISLITDLINKKVDKRHIEREVYHNNRYIALQTLGILEKQQIIQAIQDSRQDTK